MSKRVGGFIGQDGLNAPDEPTNVTGTAGNEKVSVSFTAPSDVGGAAVSGYRVTDSTGAHAASGSSSPITVSGLTNDTEYTFRVWAINPFGWSQPSGVSGGVTPFLSPHALLSGSGSGASPGGHVQYVNITTTGNATSFGSLTVARLQAGSVGSTTRSITGGGYARAAQNVLDYTTFGTSGSYQDFGDLTTAKNRTSALSNATRGVWCGHEISNTIDYVTIASTGNATDFGDLTASRYGSSSCASPTRGVTFGSYGSPSYARNTMDYITIATTGNAAYFGDLGESYKRYGLCGSSNSVRGVVHSGSLGRQVGYITVATLGNTTDFGDLSTAHTWGASCASPTISIFASSSSDTTVIDYVTLSTTGSGADFGDVSSVGYMSGSSASHGGLA